jgi:hypothetical protein
MTTQLTKTCGLILTLIDTEALKESQNITKISKFCE